MGTVERVGGGLVEISAVTTIIGAPIAEALIHGLKAACGMAWAPMSCFGAIHVTKACLSASVPDRLRESMGLRNQFVDAAIGVMLRVDQAKNRVDWATPVLYRSCRTLYAVVWLHPQRRHSR